MKRPKIIMRTNKTDKEGNITQEPLYIQFEDKVFQTEDEQIVEFLHSLKNFGYDYREVDAVPQGYGYQGNKPVTKMDTIRHESSQEVVELRGQVEQLASGMNGIAQMLKDLLDEKKGKSASKSPQQVLTAAKTEEPAATVGGDVGLLNKDGDIQTEEKK